tara:strand:+ start:6100 stop:6309 length:210 start_codon:yes stop_codon:yes gene_type:complete
MIVSKVQQEARLCVCKECEHRKNKFLSIFNMDSCGICKCNLKAKSRLDRDFLGKCPIGKWKVIDKKFEI